MLLPEIADLGRSKLLPREYHLLDPAQAFLNLAVLALLGLQLGLEQAVFLTGLFELRAKRLYARLEALLLAAEAPSLLRDPQVLGCKVLVLQRHVMDGRVGLFKHLDFPGGLAAAPPARAELLNRRPRVTQVSPKPRGLQCQAFVLLRELLALKLECLVQVGRLDRLRRRHFQLPVLHLTQDISQALVFQFRGPLMLQLCDCRRVQEPPRQAQVAEPVLEALLFARPRGERGARVGWAQNPLKGSDHLLALGAPWCGHRRRGSRGP